MFLLIRVIVPLEMSNEVRLAFNVIGGIGALFIPIAIYAALDFKLTKRAVNKVGKNWCLANNKEFNRMEMHKNHFTLICQEAGKKIRKKFRIRFTLSTWFVRSVDWLEK
jgi:hypothetical protein